MSLVHFAWHYFLSPNAFLDNESIYNQYCRQPSCRGRARELIGFAFSALTAQKPLEDKVLQTPTHPHSSKVRVWLFMAGRCFQNIKFMNSCKWPAVWGEKTKLTMKPKFKVFHLLMRVSHCVLLSLLKGWGRGEINILVWCVVNYVLYMLISYNVNLTRTS